MKIKGCWQRNPYAKKKLLCKFKYWNSVITLPRIVKKVQHTSDFSLTSYHLETKHLANLTYKKRHNSAKIVEKIVIIKLDLDTHNIHLHTTSSFNLTIH